MNVLITGAHGFCARHLACRLAGESGVRLIGLDLQRTPPAVGFLNDYVVADVADEQAVSLAVRRSRPDVIFHLAGLMSGPPGEIHRVNERGTIALLRSVTEHAPSARVLVAGSAAEYGIVDPEDNPVTEAHPCRPQGPYGVSKHRATLAALDYAASGLRVLVLRPFNIVGAGIPPTMVVGAVLERARQALEDASDPIVRVGNLDTERDFVAVDDVVDAYVRLSRGASWGEVFNVCSGVPRTVRSVIAMLLSHARRPMRLQVDSTLVRPDDVRILYGSYRKAHEASGYVPRASLEQALHAAWVSAIDAGGDR